MEMQKIRWGLMSTARINDKIIPAIRNSQQGSLEAVASRKGMKVRSYARKNGIPRAFGSYQEMLASDAIDVVYISLPNHLHAEWTIKALQAGKHVLCEKPLALSEKEVEAIQKASQDTGYLAAEALMYRHHPQSIMIEKLIADGKLGELQSIRGVFNFILGGPKDIRNQVEMGGGALWDIGIYPVTYAQWLMKTPAESVFGVQRTGSTGIDTVFHGELMFPDNRFAQISCSFQSPSHTSVEVMGSEGRLLIPKPFNGMEANQEILYFDRYGELTAIKIPANELYLYEVEELHTAILNGVAQRVSLKESWETIRTICGLYRSAKTGQVVKL
jgi:predicted dehydrogenase